MEEDEEPACECPFEDDCLYQEEHLETLKKSQYCCIVANCPHRFFRDCLEELPVQFGVGDSLCGFPCRRHDPRWLIKKRQELGLIAADPEVENLENPNDGNIIVIDASGEDEAEEENDLDITFNSLCSDLIESVRLIFYISNI